MTRARMDCPTCAEVGPHYSADDGETWQCELCRDVHTGGAER
jgi:ribosomal protein L37AE/L43A